MKITRIVGIVLVAVGFVAVLSEIFLNASVLIYYGDPVGGFLGIFAIIVGTVFITVASVVPEIRGQGLSPMRLYIKFIDTFSENIGIGAGWFTTIMVLVVFLNVTMRYIFGGGELQPENATVVGKFFLSILGILRVSLSFVLESVGLPVPRGASLALQDLSWYVFGVIFLIGAAYTLKHDRHVRVDIFYVNYSPRTKVWTNLLGGLFFLIPICILGIWVSWDFVARSFLLQEVSPDAGGLAARYLVKSLLPLGFFLILLQGISLIFRSYLQLTDKLPMAVEHDASAEEFL